MLPMPRFMPEHNVSYLLSCAAIAADTLQRRHLVADATFSLSPCAVYFHLTYALLFSFILIAMMVTRVR